MPPERADFLICGGGIVGLTIARELLNHGHKNIVVIEKEPAPGMHASGRNSGVLHAGIYYSPESLRAKVCLKGNLQMKDYCREKHLPLLETGKVIVARNEAEVVTLKELFGRAIQNGARVELIDEKQLAEIEPNANTCAVALRSYDTAVVDPKAVVKSICDDLVASGFVKVLTDIRFSGLKDSNTALTSRGEIRFDRFINAAGAYSDRVAHAFGVGINYRMIPFKGIYKKLIGRMAGMTKGSIYPVPDIRNPFLGVHFTRGVSGDVYLGPTAIPVCGRENYRMFSGIDAEAPVILYRDAMLFAVNPKFREVALTEPQKYMFKWFYEAARALVKELDPGDIKPSDKAGIRPQLVDWNTKELVMDFLVVREGNGVHVLNAISPAFTGSMAFAEFVVREYIEG